MSKPRKFEKQSDSYTDSCRLWRVKVSRSTNSDVLINCEITNRFSKSNFIISDEMDRGDWFSYVSSYAPTMPVDVAYAAFNHYYKTGR